VTLSHDEVRRIAELAKLDLTDAEVSLYAGQLSDVLDSFQRLQQIDTSHIPPTASVLPLKNVLRDDIAGAPLTVQQVIANASSARNGQFMVEDILGES